MAPRSRHKGPRVIEAIDRALVAKDWQDDDFPRTQPNSTPANQSSRRPPILGGLQGLGLNLPAPVFATNAAAAAVATTTTNVYAQNVHTHLSSQTLPRAPPIGLFSLPVVRSNTNSALNHEGFSYGVGGLDLLNSQFPSISSVYAAAAAQCGPSGISTGPAYVEQPNISRGPQYFQNKLNAFRMAKAEKIRARMPTKDIWGNEIDISPLCQLERHELRFEDWGPPCMYGNMRQFENGYVAESGMLGYTYEDYQEPSPPASFLIWRPQQLRPLIPFSPLFETPCSTAYGLGPLPPRNITLLPPPSFVGTVTDADGVLRAPNPRVLGEDHAQLLWLLQEANHCGSDEGERTHEDNVSDVLQLHREFGQAFHERTWEVDMRDVGMSEGQAQGQASWDDLVDYGEMDGAME